MSDSSDESVNVDIPYSSRPEWSDIQAIQQDTETNEIVRIAYTEVFKEVYDYFRAILKLNEKSERAFELTKDAALLNPANYTVWYYRRILIKELNKDLKDELEFITSVINNHPKNYQVWQHRRNIIEQLKDFSQELEFTKKIIKKDSKNYHAWQYRQWVIKTFSLWSSELNYVNDLLNQDVRNNSAWNQRYFYFRNNYDLSKLDSIEILNNEIELSLSKIDTCIDNESSWNYLRAIMNHLIKIYNDEKNLNVKNSSSSNFLKRLVDFCDQKFKSNTEDDRSPFLLSFIVEMNWIKINELGRYLNELDEENKEERNKVLAELKKILDNSLEMLELLANKFDTIRANYWNYQISKWKFLYGKYNI